MDHLLSMEKASARNSVYETKKKKVEIQTLDCELKFYLVLRD